MRYCSFFARRALPESICLTYFRGDPKNAGFVLCDNVLSIKRRSPRTTEIRREIRSEGAKWIFGCAPIGRSDWRNRLTTILSAQSHLLFLDLYNGVLSAHGFRRALTLPSGSVAFHQSPDSDIPGIPGHWQRGRLRFTSLGLWLEDDGFAWLYRFDEPNLVYYTERWLPHMEVPEEARPYGLEAAAEDFAQELLDYEGSRIRSLGLPARLAQLRRIGPGIVKNEDINCWMVQIGSRFLSPYFDQLVPAVELKDA